MKVNLMNKNFESDYLKNLLTARGVTDIKKYINPTQDCLIEPSRFSNIEMGYLLFEAVL